MLRNTGKVRLFLAICFFISSQQAGAQIIDIISDYVTDKITERVTNYISNAASSFWDGMVESDARSSIEEKAKELKDYDIQKTSLNNLIVNNKYTDKENFSSANVINPIPSGIQNSFGKRIKAFGNTRLSAIGDGLVGDAMRFYSDSVMQTIHYRSLEDVLSQTALDSVNILGIPKESLLSDINKDSRLAVLFNNHPQIIRVYANSISTVYKSDLAHLYYWGVVADSHRKNLPKKSRLMNPRFIQFVQSGQLLTLTNNNEELGTFDISQQLITVYSTDLLNYMPKENLKYVYNGTYFSTDELGRVKDINFPLNKNSKKGAKNKIKYKLICNSQGITQGQELYSLILKPFKESPMLGGAIPLSSSDNVKQQNKLLKKSAKSALKMNENVRAEIKIEYNSALNTPSLVQLQIDENGQTFIYLNNGELLAKKDVNLMKKKETEILNKILRASHNSVVINGVNLRLRLSPSTSSEILKNSSGENIHLPVGTQLQYMGESDDFYAVLYKGQTVYVSKRFSSIIN
jgi:hypothetical protein